ncbi:MAG: prolyl oligopeptidase family serine peptidase, partial [Firmicutes bacterium]|nr:prolyl oligopeptidase family serine peptidase [Bacillota bacterium]
PNNGHQLLLGLESDGYFHYYKYNLDNSELTQLTDGKCEDFGQMGDKLSLSPTGEQFVFASNRHHRVERQLYIYDLNKDSLKQITDLPVTNTLPSWSPDGTKIAYLHADKRRNGDLWVYDLGSEESCQLTDSMPAGLAEKIQESELVTYKGANNWDIDAFLYKPAGFDASKKYPAIVWVHGGPVRQMRGSWHPSGGYSHFYVFNQHLASQGYVVLSPNFRGGIGYGSEFRYGLYLKKGVDDTIDIVNAGRYLKQLPFVDENRVAVYGLSYGGYMTLHSLTQYPEEFAAGINLAGLWDIAQWARWMKEIYENYNGDAYFGGNIEERPDLWSLGSPVTYKENLCKPLMSLQGTADPNVDFDQLNSLVKDLTKMGSQHEAIYYPDEMHTFRWRHTWQDALPRMVAFFDQYLKG